MALLIALLPRHATAGGERWTKIQSPNFLLIGDADEPDIRRVAERLERFREMLIRVIGDAASRSPAPTVVIVFANERSFAPYRPQFQGRPVPTHGYFQPGDDVNYIALMPGQRLVDSRAIFHEYTHAMVDTVAGRVPVWLNEGLAGFFETFEEQDDGRTVLVGRPAASSLRALGQMMPLTVLMSVDQSSPIYNDRATGELFYAQSWALVHYLLAHRSRAEQLPTYLAEIDAGAQPTAALASAFKTTAGALEEELKCYLRRFTFPATRLSFAEHGAGAGIQRGSRIPQTEARTYLADMLARLGRTSEATAQIHGVLRDNPYDARALASLGVIALRDGRVDEAIQWLERAVELAPDAGGIQGILGRALCQRLHRWWHDGHDAKAVAELAARARSVLSKAISLSPSTARPRIDLALVELIAGSDPARARLLVEEALGLAPGRDSYRQILSRLLAANQQGLADPAAALKRESLVKALMTFRPDPRGRRPGKGDGIAIAVEVMPAD